MGQNRDVTGLPAPRVLRSDDERLKWDTRVYDAIGTLQDALESSGIVATSTTGVVPATILWTRRLVFFGSEDGKFKQEAGFSFTPSTIGVPILNVPRIRLAASDTSVGTAPIYFNSSSLRTSVAEFSALENEDPWLYYSTSPDTGLLTEAGGRLGSNIERYQLMGMHPNRLGVVTGYIPFGYTNDEIAGDGLCTTSSELLYVNQNATATNYLDIPRLFLRRTGGASSYPALQYNTTGATLVPVQAGATGSYPTIPAPDYNGLYPGAVECDGAALYFTASNGTRRQLMMHDPLTNGFWSRDTVNGFIYPTTSTDLVGIGTSSPVSHLHVVNTVAGSAGAALLASHLEGVSSSSWIVRRSRGTPTVPTDVQNGDDTGGWNAQAYSGGTYFDCASQNSKVDGTFTSGQRPPSRWEWYTNTANQIQTLNMVLTSTGILGLGTGSAPSTSSMFHVKATQNSSLNTRLENLSAGSAAQSNYQAYNNSGVLSQLGIASSGYSAYGALVAGIAYAYSNSAQGFLVMADGGRIVLAAGGNAERCSVPAAGGFVIGTAALATTATDGFLYLATTAGTPTGVPTSLTGRAPILYDTTGDKLWIYDGGWQSIPTGGTALTGSGAANRLALWSGTSSLTSSANFAYLTGGTVDELNIGGGTLTQTMLSQANALSGDAYATTAATNGFQISGLGSNYPTHRQYNSHRVANAFVWHEFQFADSSDISREAAGWFCISGTPSAGYVNGSSIRFYTANWDGSALQRFERMAISDGGVTIRGTIANTPKGSGTFADFTTTAATFSFLNGNATTVDIAQAATSLTIGATTGSTTIQNATVIGTAALATNATTGFLYIPSCAGTPTGVPTAFTGRLALVYDSTNKRLYVYNGAWESVLFA